MVEVVSLTASEYLSKSTTPCTPLGNSPHFPPRTFLICSCNCFRLSMLSVLQLVFFFVCVHEEIISRTLLDPNGLHRSGSLFKSTINRSLYFLSDAAAPLSSVYFPLTFYSYFLCNASMGHLQSAQGPFSLPCICLVGNCCNLINAHKWALVSLSSLAVKRLCGFLQWHRA